VKMCNVLYETILVMAFLIDKLDDMMLNFHNNLTILLCTVASCKHALPLARAFSCASYVR
jgi:hypothetical protein